MVTINELTFSYRRTQKVFENFSLHLHKGSVYGLLGLNGAGKSTLLYLMCGLLRPQHGSVLFEGVDVRRRRADTLANLFLVPEEFALPRGTMAQYARLNAPFYPRFSHELLRTCLQGFEMDTDVELHELSMGQKKKAFVCFALATNTALLLMDEPSNGLDIPSKSQFRRVLASGMTDERTIVISTHQVADVDALIDRVAIIDHSRLLVDEPVSNICQHLRFENRALKEPTDDALYVQPSFHGNGVVCAMHGDEPDDSPLNLELLFNAAISAPEKITELFTKNEMQ